MTSTREGVASWINCSKRFVRPFCKEASNEKLTACCASLQEEKRARKHIKLLLLGAGASGKSTVLKQMRLIHNVTFTEEEIEGGSIHPKTTVHKATSALTRDWS